MTRGRRPAKALEEAEKIAEKRGLVQYYERGPGLICDFSIARPGMLAQVRIKRMRYIRCTAQWLERDAMDEIAGLRMFPSSQEISRELWICSPKYFLRFFRVCDQGLVELGPDGLVLPAKSPAAGSAVRAGAPAPVPRTSMGVPFPVPSGDDARSGDLGSTLTTRTPSENDTPGDEDPELGSRS